MDIRVDLVFKVKTKLAKNRRISPQVFVALLSLLLLAACGGSDLNIATVEIPEFQNSWVVATS